MTTKITRDIIESYLDCKYEGHIKLVGQRGIQSDYGVLLAESRYAVRCAALDKISARHAGEEIEFFLNATLENDHIALAFKIPNSILVRADKVIE